MRAEENIAKTKALETVPIHKMKCIFYELFLKPAKDGFQNHPVQLSFQWD